MKKRFLLMVILLVGVFINLTNVNASEGDFNFNSFSFDYVDASGWIQDMVLAITIDCDYPEGVPHHYWLYSEKYTHEKIYLFGPKNLTYYGNIESGRFITDLEPPPGGQYNFTVYNWTSGSTLYSINFNMEYKFETDLESVKWITGAHTFEPSYKSSVNEDDIYKINGIQINFNLTNNGDIPFKIGDPYTEEIPIYLKIKIFKDKTDEPLFSSEPKKLKRIVKNQGYNEKWFFKPGEIFECKESIINNSIKLKPGTYSVYGSIQPANTSTVRFEPIHFSSVGELKITENKLIPGFKILTIVFSIILVFLLYRNKKR